ncbi:immune inhibitor A domain-containing protein [Psychrobium sp. MM17-31]|uniref:immune inhibitor A domain-containing protein n=1 Tax=Psychrobium sp. MM17-31 TaxID=2917758 RepID=UPI0023B83E56|nr:immune inhibitor A domain-containing protein [Psychrobium sp. MM17-31]
MQKIVQSLAVSLAMLPMLSYGAMKKHSVVDEALIDRAKIEYWLKKRGEIGADDNQKQISEKVSAFISRYRNTDKRSVKMQKNYPVTKVSSKAFQQYVLADNSQKTTDVNVLAVLIDFPNLTYQSNGLSSNDTDLFYSDYSLAHYRDLLFSSDGFAGPDSQNLMSVKQYYSLESGNTFNFNGQAFGWYRAKNSASFYGGNGDAGNDQNAERLVVEAIEAAVASGDVNLSDYDLKDPQDLDNDGNTNESDGYIDHVLIVHSSVGEEAGGGVLGTNAIWSHRFSVPDSLATIAGSNVKVKNYTIVPIDSGSGVIAHEFGHDLGLDDEYDLKSTLIGSPVGYWSIMSGGSWLGELRGTEPTSFSPYARDILQQKFGGNWINQQELQADDLTNAGIDVMLTQASDHNASYNQTRIELPARKELFGAPKQGEYQLLAEHENQSHFIQEFAIDVPSNSAAQIALWARWDIEEGYDYARFLINGTALSNDNTVETAANIPNKSHLLTGKLNDAPWTELVFDIGNWAGQSVTFTIEYVTDPAVGGFGIAVDDVRVITPNNSVTINDFEQGFTAHSQDGFKAFKRITEFKDAAPAYYYVQVRSAEKLDKGLAEENYDPGVLLWFRNDAFSDNNSSEHPGEGFIGVVDADQNRLSFGATQRQIRDAAFSLFPQSALSGDSHLSAYKEFKDSDDYSAPAQPQNGVKLPQWGIEFAVTQQDPQSKNATINLSRTPIELTSEITANREGLTVNFNHNTTSSYSVSKTMWAFGDGNTSNELNPSHTYEAGGQYEVSLTIEDTSGAQFSTKKTVTIGAELTMEANYSVDTTEIFDVTFTSDAVGGVPPLVYAWDFGDGNTSALANAKHKYTEIGSYQVEVTVTDAIDQSVTKTFNVAIKSALSVQFTHTAANQVVTFTSQLSGAYGDTTVSWNFGDGQTSNATTPNHVYANAGTYTVELTATDASGTTDKTTKQIVVSPASSSSTSSSESSGGSLGGYLLALISLLSLRRISQRRKIT